MDRILNQNKTKLEKLEFRLSVLQLNLSIYSEWPEEKLAGLKKEIFKVESQIESCKLYIQLLIDEGRKELE